MKLKLKQEFHEKTVDQLKADLAQTQKALGRVVLERKMGKHTNVHMAKNLKNKSAVIQTILRSKQLGEKS